MDGGQKAEITLGKKDYRVLLNLSVFIGQLLISVDYMMKSLWHGAYFPKEKRTKFNDKWREHFQVSKQNGKPEKEKSFISDFLSHGL